MMRKHLLRRTRALAAPALAFFLQAFAPPVADAAPQAVALDGAAESTDILTRLQAVPGLTVTERPTRVPGTRTFLLRLQQPVDHQRPDGRRFSQFMTLLHRAPEAPVMMNTGGYGVSPFVREIELSRLLQANQLYVEHRFFGESVPQPATYEHLTLQQAAADIHRVVETLKGVYPARWVTSGSSKGGMTAIYHRYFYPDDVAATVAYGAPSSHGPTDERYMRFINSVGDAACREQLRELQKAALRRRAELLPFMAGVANDWLTSFHRLGEDRAFEFGVVEFPFYFWQSLGIQACSQLPSPDAPAGELFAFIDSASLFALNFDDFGVGYYGPYYYQAATQLGAPRYAETHLHGLLHYPGEDVPSFYSPVSVPKPFEHPLMLAVEHWVRNDAQHLLVIYGQNDPWSTGGFEVRERNDSYRLQVANGTHSTGISTLSEADRRFALERLSTWLGLAPASARLAPSPEASEEWVYPAQLERLQPGRQVP